MAAILCIETSSEVCSVALAKDGICTVIRESAAGYTHAENLTVFIQDVMAEAGISLPALDAVAVSKGPGSYTGLRIGVSTAKGLCYALDKPLIGIETLSALASAATKETGDREGFYGSLIDARRMEVYYAVFDFKLNVIQPPAAKIIDEDSFSDLLAAKTLYLSGNGAEKTTEKLIFSENAVRTGIKISSALHLAELAEKYYREKKFENMLYAEPFYLKDFAGKRLG